MNSDAAYSAAGRDAQKNLTLEFSSRARGVPVWAALRSQGRLGDAELVDRHCGQAVRIADGLRALGLVVLATVALNQVLVRGRDDEETLAILSRVQAPGRAWFGATVWQGRPASRINCSSWQTAAADVERLIQTISLSLPARP